MRSLGICIVLALIVVVGTASERGLDKGGQAVQVVLTDVASDIITFKPTVKFEEIRLSVSGPKGSYESTFGPGDAVFFDLVDDTGASLADGSYTWQIVVTPIIDQGLRLRLEEARKAGDDRVLSEFSAANRASGSFTIADGAAVDPDALETGINTRDQVILDDLIVDGSACIGMDCVNGESFGFDTIRLKENNLRIRFQDTSASASFPSVDWQLTANDSANGGANKFSIDDLDSGRTPFTIEASAPNNSLYVDDGGRIGIGTATPVVELHVVNGDSPTLRLEQDGSSGFAPQTWDVAGNETNFFIRDVSNGSTLPFRIRPSAPTSALDIAGDGDIGFGTTSPAARVEIEDSDVGPFLRIDHTAGMSTVTVLEAETHDTNNMWQFNVANSGALRFDNPGNVGDEMLMSATGNVTIGGNLNVGGTLTKGGGAFKIDHPLDPKNKFLVHSFVESPDMMNIYNGNAVLDESGQAVVELPEWFGALNADFRYQLTAIGQPAPGLFVAEEVQSNQFKIAGGEAGTRVSWQVTGVRQDAWAKANRLEVETEKPAGMKGAYLHPNAFKKPSTKKVRVEED